VVVFLGIDAVSVSLYLSLGISATSYLHFFAVVFSLFVDSIQKSYGF